MGLMREETQAFNTLDFNEENVSIRYSIIYHSLYQIEWVQIFENQFHFQQKIAVSWSQPVLFVEIFDFQTKYLKKKNYSRQ